jgi:hypothetical protein
LTLRTSPTGAAAFFAFLPFLVVVISVDDKPGPPRTVGAGAVVAKALIAAILADSARRTTLTKSEDMLHPPDYSKDQKIVKTPSLGHCAR